MSGNRRRLEDRAVSADWAGFKGRRTGAAANAPLLLADAGDGILVLQGHVDMFAVRVENGAPTGQRHSLFRAHAGEVVFGPDADAPFKFLAVGMDETEVLHGVSDDDLAGLAPDHLAAILDRFVGGLSGCLAKDAPEGATMVLDANAEAEVYANNPIFAASRRAVWVTRKDTAGLLALYGDAGLTADVLPLTSSMWATSDGPGTVFAASSQALITAGEWRTAIDAYVQVFGRFLDSALQKMENEAVARRDTRSAMDKAALENALHDLTRVVRQDQPAAPGPDAAQGNDLHAAFLAVAQALGIETAATPRTVTRHAGVPAVDSLASAYRVRIRRVLLRDDWWRHDAGPLLAFTDADVPMALLPRSGGGYDAFDPATGARTQVTVSAAERFQGEAVMLYPPLPSACRSLRDLLRAVLPEIRSDLRLMGTMGFAGGLIAAFTPVMTSVMIKDVLPSADIEQHIQIILGLVVAAFGAASFEVVKAIALLRVEGRADLRLQAAVFDRMMRLPARFFRRYTVGDLSDRVLGVHVIRQTLSGTTMQGLLGAVFAVFSLALLLFFNWKLAIVAFGLVFAALSITVYWGRRQLAEERLRIARQGEVEGFVIQSLTGLGKIRVSAAESRAYARWAGMFARQKRRFVRAQSFANLQDIFHAVFPVLATAVIFAVASVLLEQEATDLQLQALVQPEEAAGNMPMSTGDFIAFNTAFGQFLAAMTALVLALTRSLAVLPVFERLRPIIEEPVEVAASDRSVQRLRGGIEFSQVGFRYVPGGPRILDDFNLTIEPNEFVAIVGPSGSGKSTLIRLLLGFEQCEAGEIYYDQTPISRLDMTSVRRQVRVVLQHGQLISGSVFSNIVGAATTLTQEDAWRAARLAGLDKDIEAMPMGMHTQIMEGVNTISGGQRQRLMIARVLVHRPRILLLDEPTSALDNRTQDIVMSTLSHLTATRIVIAHRLSTVRAADRIIVMDKGRILQQGTFDELMAEEGPFREMAQRQLV